MINGQRRNYNVHGRIDCSVWLAQSVLSVCKAVQHGALKRSDFHILDLRFFQPMDVKNPST